MADLFDGLEKINEKPVLQKGGSQTVRRNEDSAVSVEKVVDCELCRQSSGIFDFSLICCRVRHVVSEPRLEVRQAWIERWNKSDSAMGKAVEQEVLVRWSKSKGAMR